ncbi:MAG TPA: DUF2442 domain-containing protein [Edaphobacter sp.]|nr:DUF2442 domain-containing protein [Edaphobacter sp.]
MLPCPGYRVWVRFQDGTTGEADLSHLVGKGVFVAWCNPREFEKVYVDAESGTLAWPGGLDVAPDALYDEIHNGRQRDA